jgi:hypothetical protein
LRLGNPARHRLAGRQVVHLASIEIGHLHFARVVRYSCDTFPIR